MARLIPNAPANEVNAETLKVLRLLKRLPDETFTVWHELGLDSEPRPDFWVLRQDRRALFVSVATDTIKEVYLTQQASLFDQPKPALQTRTDLAIHKIQVAAQFGDHLQTPLPTVLVFPNLDQAEIMQIQAVRHAPSIQSYGKSVLNPEHFLSWIERHLSEPLTEAMIENLRKAYTPEVIVPARFTVRSPSRNTQSQLTEYLLDYDQEWVLKTDLALTPEGESAARAFGVHLVNGVAGSGKSLILLYRAHLLRQLYPTKTILVLTHNQALIRDLKARYQHLRERDPRCQDMPMDGATEWKTFQGWCKQHWMREPSWRTPIDHASRRVVIQRAWQTHLANTLLSPQMLQEEIDWYKDRLLFTRADYLASERTGRGFALTESMRHKVYDAYETYTQELHHHHWLDWGDVPRHIWKQVQAKQPLPSYDIILVDEAQFFAPLWFEILKQVLKPVTGHLFLSADPSQGFLQRRQSWLASGLDVRGHATYLPRSYRTTREILRFATLFYHTRLPAEDEEIVRPTWQDMPAGVSPEMKALTSEQDEVTYVVHEIHALVKGKVPLEHILVITPDYRMRDRLRQRLENILGNGMALDPARALPGSHIRLCLLNGATGLESPIVFVLGLHRLLETEQSLRLTNEERCALIRDNTRKLYMAMTRAGQRLVITGVGDAQALFQSAWEAKAPAASNLHL